MNLKNFSYKPRSLIVSMFLFFASAFGHSVVEQIVGPQETHIALAPWEYEEKNFPPFPAYITLALGVTASLGPAAYLHHQIPTLITQLNANNEASLSWSALYSSFALVGALGGYMGSKALDLINILNETKKDLDRIYRHAQNTCKYRGYDDVGLHSVLSIYSNDLIQKNCFTKEIPNEAFYRNKIIFLDGHRFSSNTLWQRGANYKSPLYVFKTLWCAKDSKSKDESLLDQPDVANFLPNEKFNFSALPQNLMTNHKKINALLVERKFQEAMWLCHEKNYKTQYEAIKKYIENELRTGHYAEVPHDLGGSTNGKRLLQFEGGFKALFKPDAKYSFNYRLGLSLIEILYYYIDNLKVNEWLNEHDFSNSNGSPDYRISSAASEIAAYALDQLFAFQLVPVTIPFMTRDHQRGSLQYYINDATIFSKKNYLSIEKKLLSHFELFKYLIGEADGNDNNLLQCNIDGRLISIDHGMSFRAYSFDWFNIEKLKEFLKSADQKLLNKINLMSDDEVARVLVPLIDKKYIEKVLARLRLLRSLL